MNDVRTETNRALRLRCVYAPGHSTLRTQKNGSEPKAENHERAERVEWWAGLDSNQRSRKAADLQSAPFDHFGTDPRLKTAAERAY